MPCKKNVKDKSVKDMLRKYKRKNIRECWTARGHKNINSKEDRKMFGGQKQMSKRRLS